MKIYLDLLPEEKKEEIKRKKIFLKVIHSELIFAIPMIAFFVILATINFSLKEKNAPAKMKMFQKLIMLEMMPNIEQRRYAYLEYCLSGLADSQSWTRSHVLQEWQHFIKNYSQILRSEHLIRLREICEKIPEFTTRQSLEKDMVSLQKKISQPVPTQDQNITPTDRIKR